jgi:hypothetical protein
VCLLEIGLVDQLRCDVRAPVVALPWLSGSRRRPPLVKPARNIGRVEAQVPADSNCNGALPAVAPSVDSGDWNLENLSQFLDAQQANWPRFWLCLQKPVICFASVMPISRPHCPAPPENGLAGDSSTGPAAWYDGTLTLLAGLLAFALVERDRLNSFMAEVLKSEPLLSLQWKPNLVQRTIKMPVEDRGSHHEASRLKRFSGESLTPEAGEAEQQQLGQMCGDCDLVVIDHLATKPGRVLGASVEFEKEVQVSGVSFESCDAIGADDALAKSSTGGFSEPVGDFKILYLPAGVDQPAEKLIDVPHVVQTDAVQQVGLAVLVEVEPVCVDVAHVGDDVSAQPVQDVVPRPGPRPLRRPEPVEDPK